MSRDRDLLACPSTGTLIFDLAPYNTPLRRLALSAHDIPTMQNQNSSDRLATNIATANCKLRLRLDRRHHRGDDDVRHRREKTPCWRAARPCRTASPCTMAMCSRSDC